MTIGVFEIGNWELCLLGVLLLAFVYEVYFYARYMWVRKKDERSAVADDGEKPGVSVVVCARNEGYNLRPYIQSLLTQDYPLYEVIIVNDGSEDDTQTVIDEYAALDKRVKTTFVPIGARVRSTKKLGLTLAAKAAQYDYLLLTDADCRPESIHWISSMMEGFGNGERLAVSGERIEVVLGYGAYFSEDSLLNEVIQYDTLFNGVHYLGAAATGKPYMGVGRNLAYRKETFFEHGGFSDLMTEGAGDDDLFVNKVATKHNTAIVCTPESVTWSVPKRTWKSWLQQKRRHLSVSGAYNTRSKGHLMREPLARGVFYLLFVVLMVIGSPLVMSAAFVLFLLRMLLLMSMLDVSARRLGQPQMGVEVVWFDMLLPVVTGVMLMLPKRKGIW